MLHGQSLSGKVKYSLSEVLIQWSTHSVTYSFNEVLIQWSSHSVKYSISEVFIQWSTTHLSSRLRELEEIRVDLFGLFGLPYGIPAG